MDNGSQRDLEYCHAAMSLPLTDFPETGSLVGSGVVSPINRIE